MKIKNISTLIFNKLSKEQFKREKESGRIDESSFYLVPDDEIVVDSELSEESENPIQNKVVAREIGELQNSMADNERAITEMSQIMDDYPTREELPELVETIISGEDNSFSETGDVVELAVEAETPLSVVSKIHRDSTWGLSDKLVLHHVSGSNFVDLSAFMGGAGTVIKKNGITATINDDSTVTICGTNESTDYTYIIDNTYWSGEYSEKVYPAGTYSRPEDLMIYIRAAQYPQNNSIAGFTSNLGKTVTIPEPFRIVQVRYPVKAGATVDVTLPLGLFRGDSVPETGFEYNGQIHTVTFDNPVYDGEFNWATGELKDADGNTVAYYDSHDIMSLEGTNYFWTGFGENTVSNRKDNGKVIIRLNETAPDETVPSICDFMLTPTTPEAAYGLYYAPFLGGGQFTGNEVPVLTTKGTLSVKDADGNVKYSKYVQPIFNTRGVADVLTHKGLEKKWSEKFYLNKEPVSIIHKSPPYSGALDTYVFIWEFDESEFVNTGIPAKIHDIPMASPCFINDDSSENKVNNTQEIWNGDPYPAFFSYNEETDKYILTARGIQGDSIKHQLTTYSKVHFYYQLETPYNLSFAFAMGIDAGDKITFEPDLTDNQPYIDALSNFKNKSIDPSVTAFIPRNTEDAMDGMNNAARMLNMDDVTGGDATVQGYSWIGAGDGVTDYTVQIQSKLDELHTISNGGTIHLGHGTYPISKSLIVYGNTQIIGNGHTTIEQRADNTHAVIWNGSNIRMCDLTIKLAGVCTEITACIYVNSDNVPNRNRDERYPENMYVQYCSTSNVTLVGTYGFSWDEGYPYLSDEALAYRGVGIYGQMYFNFYDSSSLTCEHLYSGIYGGGGSNNYRLFVTDSRFAVHGGGGNNIFDIQGHTLYGYGHDENRILATDYVYYGKYSDGNIITIGFYDSQYAKGVVYFDAYCQRNHYTMFSDDSGLSSNASASVWGHDFSKVTDYGRGNIEVQPCRERFVGIGSCLSTITQLPYWNTQFNPSIHNALSGAGIWGSITSNKGWISHGINLSDVCRYPKETLKTGFGLAYTLCDSSPSEDSPVEIVIDISDRPVTNYQGYWIQFDHKYVAEDYTVSFDTTNDGVFNYSVSEVTGNIDSVSYKFNYQEVPQMVYRIKISITKALQVPELKYIGAGYVENTINYNPDGLIGIVNIGMPSNEAYGRAFLGECGGSLYGSVDMHQNTLKNLPAPTEDGDAVSKAYLDESVTVLSEAIVEINQTIGIKPGILSPNIFDKTSADVIIGGYVGFDGEIVANEKWLMTPKIPIAKNDVLRIMWDGHLSDLGSAMTAFYDENGNWTSTKQVSYSAGLTIVWDSYSYVRLLAMSRDIDKIMVTKNDNTIYDTYYPYGTTPSSCEIIEDIARNAENIAILANGKWFGKNGAAFGTSLTYRSQTTGGYLTHLSELTGIEFDNQGVGSSKLYGEASDSILNKIRSYTGYSDKDICIIEGFVNDWYMESPLGSFTDSGESSVCGCLRTAINHVMTQNNSIRIFVVLDHYGTSYDGMNLRSTANIKGVTQYAYYEELNKVCESMGIPVVRQYAESQICENTPQYFIDQIHLNELGAKASATCIYGKLSLLDILPKE